MKNLIIYGAGGFGREVACWVKSLKELKFKGFLDDDKNALNGFGLEEFYLGNMDSYEFKDDDFVVIAIANSDVKEMLYKKLKAKGVKFTNVVHESVIVGDRVRFGEGNIICPYGVISVDVQILDCNIFNLHATIGHDAKIGSFNTFNSHCDITGNTSIKDRNFFGSRVSVLPSAKIGNNNKIAAGSVVYKGIRDNLIYLGNPARKVGKNE